ncbi:MAG: malic enzyme-like NAD(P)-binding protein [bacterium]|nr:malic enzyme-like NAD(P)-binding protein [bacterium]
MDALDFHKKYRGKVKIMPKMDVSQKNLHIVYTPGVAQVTKKIAENPQNSFIYTSRCNNAAIITDGTRTIGVGNTIPEASMPVMEGKAILFKILGNVDAYPLCLGTKSAKEIVRTVEILEPSFGAFNIEDIESPKCFEIMEELEQKKILTFHDDQQGTAIVVLAGILNAFKAMKKDLKKSKICLAGAGAAGYGVFKILKEIGIKNLVVFDNNGLIYKNREGDNKYQREIGDFSNRENKRGGLKEAIEGADLFIGLTGKAGLLKTEHISLMNKNPIIFALSNPVPEIFPEEINKTTKNYLYATGRSDFPNQINNAIAFPGVFRGILDKRRKIDLKLEVKIAKAIANLIKNPSKKRILPDVFDKRLLKTIANCF